MLVVSQVLLTLLMIYVALTTLHNLRTMIRLPVARASGTNQPLVSVLIPARNEAHNLPTSLASVLRQAYPHLEVLVLDDDSRDETSAVVEQFAAQDDRLRLLHGALLPEGWQGKSWACHQLYEQSHGEWLLFLDADTRLRSDAIASAVAAAQQGSLDMLSLLPDLQLNSFGLRVLLALIPFVLIGWVSHNAFTGNPNPMMAIAYGPFILVRRHLYEVSGGHQAIRSDIVDDVGLARAFKRVGGRIALADGVDVMQVASFANARTAWRSITKSIYPVFNYNLVTIFLTVIVVTLIYVTPYLLLANSLWLGAFTLTGFWMPLIQVLLAASVMGLIGRRFLIPTWYASLYLFTLLLGVVLCLDSAYVRTLGPGTVWKDRIYHFGK
ncbi:MAG: glycosyltransferase family 2 protein [Anaerolineae bacterium]